MKKENKAAIHFLKEMKNDLNNCISLIEKANPSEIKKILDDILGNDDSGFK